MHAPKCHMPRASLMCFTLVCLVGHTTKSGNCCFKADRNFHWRTVNGILSGNLIKVRFNHSKCAKSKAKLTACITQIVAAARDNARIMPKAANVRSANAQKYFSKKLITQLRWGKGEKRKGLPHHDFEHSR